VTDDDDPAIHLALGRLHAAYADIVTRRAWPELHALFVPDAAIVVDTVTAEPIVLRGAGELGSFIGRSIERFEFFEFVVLNLVLRVTGPTEALGRLYMVEIRQEAGTGEWSNAFGVYHDRYRIHDGRWRLAERNYQSLARRIGAGPATVFPFPGRFVV